MTLFDGTGRPRPANYVAITRNIADSYPDGIPHGVQKDAIQNAVDARIGRSPVHFVVELVETDKGKFLTLTDRNTTGLTGRVLTEADYTDDLPEKERWARFESFAFTKDDPDALGARGQGKFIFLAASRIHRMLYDTLRRDGVYRVGATEARTTGCPIFPSAGDGPWEGETGARTLRQETGLDPLAATGTRVIVVDPTDEIVMSLRDGGMLSSIEETWFRSLEKGQLAAEVVVAGTVAAAKVPAPFPIPARDSARTKTWILGKDTNSDKIIIGRNTYHVKHMHVAYSDDSEVPLQHRGIAIIHFGMKIVSLSGGEGRGSPDVMRTFPYEKKKRIYGFVEFDRELDRELRRTVNQAPNHYDLNWRQALPKAIKQYVEDQLIQFGKAKLGLDPHPEEKKRRQRQGAEEWALRQLAICGRELGLLSGRRGPVPVSNGNGKPSRPTGVRIHAFEFPVPERRPRVNWGEAIKDFWLVPFNRTGERVRGLVDGFILYGDTKVRELLPRQAVDIPAHGTAPRLGPLEVEFTEVDFPEKGEYRLRVRLLDPEGYPIDEQTRRIFVEDDPPFTSPFEVIGEDFSYELFPEELRALQWYRTGHIGSDPVLHYNTRHPAYGRYEDESGQALGEYLFGVFLEGAIGFVLDRPDVSEVREPDYHPLDGRRIRGGPVDAYEEIAAKLAEIRKKFYEAH